MTTLKCSATTCIYNEDHLCSRGEIDVMGAGAHRADETSCGSFRERSEGSASNRTGCGCHEIQIECKAHHCTYNEDCKCTADAIHVAGEHAADSHQTECSTFQCKE